ncbi:MAG: hypothetical protein CTY12_03300 [Methylotenera sp.]|nr:MAG: hypothetical protein CTY12_03300 [Methylotenera sp.]
MKKPVLYVESIPGDKKNLLFDFCYSAKMGALDVGIKVKHFENVSEIPGDPTNIVVGSVEVCSEWLVTHGYQVPKAIDLLLWQEFCYRELKPMLMSDFKQYALESVDDWTPVFIKPYQQIKAFTGFVVFDPRLISLFSYDFDGPILVQPEIDIVSEYRVYVNCQRIVDIKHYSGDPLVFPIPEQIKKCVDFSNRILDNHSFTLDFGVRSDGCTDLIEVNDGWAIGNYGLEPQQYYLFVRNRWLQMTGIRKRMELI